MLELAYKRKARLRGKNRKLRVSLVCDINNLRSADHDARKGKSQHKGVRYFDRHPNENLESLEQVIRNGGFHTSEGHECKRLCPCGKVRILHKLPYYPDHIMHHALMRVIMPTLMRSYYYDSYASVKGKGMHFAARRTERWIDENKDAGRLYYAKMDFVKFYHNIDQKKIYDSLSGKFGDKGVRHLIHEVVTACDEGLGIGLFPIQPFANYYTCELCRMLMSQYDVRVEIYCDDLVIMSRQKQQVWKAVEMVRRYADQVMCQPLHDNIGVQIIDENHFLDFVGYRFYFGHTLLRKRMKEKMKRSIYRLRRSGRARYRYDVATSYKGWLMHSNGFNLWKSVMHMKSFKDLQVPKFERLDADGKRVLDGTRMPAGSLAGREIVFCDVEFDVRSNYKKPAAVVQVEDNNRKCKFFTSNPKLIQTLKYIKDHDGFPFIGTLRQMNNVGPADYEIE